MTEEEYNVFIIAMNQEMDVFARTVTDAAEQLTEGLVETGEISEDDLSAFLDALMRAVMVTSDKAELIAAEQGIELPEGFAESFSRNLIDGTIDDTNRLLERVRLLIAQFNEEQESTASNSFC